MALKDDIRLEVGLKLEEYEGRIDHMYLDSLGKVTIGIGSLLSSRNSVAALQMIHRDSGDAASLLDMENEYDRIASQRRGYRASWYKQFCELSMVPAAIDAQRDEHVESFYSELVGLYSRVNGYAIDFDEMPKSVQLALFDMVFNLGITKLRTLFINFNEAIKLQQWDKAGEESRRRDIADERNQYVKTLFASAYGESGANTGNV